METVDDTELGSPASRRVRSSIAVPGAAIMGNVHSTRVRAADHEARADVADHARWAVPVSSRLLPACSPSRSAPRALGAGDAAACER